MTAQTFGDKVLSFYDGLSLPSNLPANIEVINPLENSQTKKYIRKFFSIFFNDTGKRVFVLGINPGRFGSGVTGVNFTDPIALEEYCGIQNRLQKRRELSSEFVYTFINEWGGAKKFYSDFFLSAVSPIGFTNKGLNYNYYDDKSFLNLINPFIVNTLKSQCSLGARESVILFGTGKNQKLFTQLNDKYHFFKKIYALEHPRYIMQYKRKHVNEYLRKYKDVFKQALLTT